MRMGSSDKGLVDVGLVVPEGVSELGSPLSVGM